MLHELFIQGYTLTALLFLLLIIFNDKNAGLYLRCVRMANRLLWFYMGCLLAFVALSYVMGSTLLLFKPAFSDIFYILPEFEFWMLIFPYCFVFVALLFTSVRNKPVLTMIGCGLLLNFSNVPTGEYDSIKSVLFALIFLCMVAFFMMYANIVRKAVKDEENRMPEKI